MAVALERTIDLPPMTRTASFRPKTWNEEARTIELVWTTGQRVLRGYYERHWEELSLEKKHVRMKRLNNGAPFLNTHNSYDARSVLGVVEKAWLEDGQGVAIIRFAKPEDLSEDDEKIARKIIDGILQNISVGYRTYKSEKVEDGADKVPVYRAIDWEPYELSTVPMGADDGAGTRSQNPQTTTPCVFVTPRAATVTKKERAMADDDETPNTEPETTAIAATRAAKKARVEDAKERAAEKQAAAEEATDKERLRIAHIHKLARQHKLGPDWADKLIREGTSERDANDAVLKLIADEPDEIDGSTGVRIGAGDDARDKFVRGASAWLFERTGTRSLIERAAKKNPEAFKGVTFDAGEFRGYSPIELARLSLERAGVKTRGMDKMAMIGLAFTHRSGGLQTTSDFAIMLENVLGKVLLGAYATLPTTWERFCGTDQVPDFRTSNRYYTGAFPSLPTVGEHAEYKNAEIPDATKRPVTTERKGLILGLSREAIVNDDMGALTNMATEIGNASGRTLEENVYAFLAENAGLGPTQSDAQPYFHANRLNVGVGAALTAAALDADAAVMSYQKDPTGRALLDLQPAVLVVPRPLRGAAQVINESQYDPDANNKLQRPNAVRGLFSDIIGSPYLASGTTRRYLFADPNVAPAIVVAYLEGFGRGPMMETKDGWRIDGVEWKVTLYAKVQAGDPKGAVTNAGAP